MNIRKLLSSLKQIWISRKGIFQGIYFKFFTTDEYIEDVAAARFNICLSCPKLDGLGDHCMVPGTQPCCAECGCSLSMKLRALSAECPLGKWKAVMSQEEEDKLV